MAKSKAELENDSLVYHSRLDAANEALALGLYKAAVEIALSTGEFIDGMMQYESRWNDRSFSNVEVVDLILKYSPLLLKKDYLDKLEAILDAYKRIDRIATDDIADLLSKAKAQIWKNHQLWHHIEMNPDCLQEELREKLGGDQTEWVKVIMSWERMGLVIRKPESRTYKISLATRMGQIVEAKCSLCGHVEAAPKLMFLNSRECSNCVKYADFVLLPCKTN